jgi:hypothetical protein
VGSSAGCASESEFTPIQPCAMARLSHTCQCIQNDVRSERYIENLKTKLNNEEKNEKE